MSTSIGLILVNQKEDESLKEYIKHFHMASLNIKNLEDQKAIDAFIMRLLSDFYERAHKLEEAEEIKRSTRSFHWKDRQARHFAPSSPSSLACHSASSPLMQTVHLASYTSGEPYMRAGHCLHTTNISPTLRAIRAGCTPASSPYYLHPNKNPSLVLVTPPLSSSNYHHWSRTMRMALLSKNKLQFVDGSIPAPSHIDPLFSAWERCNNMVISWLNHSITPFIFNSVLWIDKASDIWIDLRERFSQDDLCRISDLQEEIYAFKQDDKSDYVIHFLKGLNDSFSAVRSQILLMDPLPSINKAFSRVIQQERQFNITSSKSFLSNTIIFANDSSMKSQSSTSSSIYVDKRWCTFCQRPRHTIDTCYKKNGYPSGDKPRAPISRAHNVVSDDIDDSLEDSKPVAAFPAGDSSHSFGSSVNLPQEQYDQLLALLQASSLATKPTTSSPSHVTNHIMTDPTSSFSLAASDGNIFTPSSSVKFSFWIVDTGATDHITHSLSSFTFFKRIKPIFVTLPNGSKVSAHFSGTVIFNDHLCLTDVLYIPQFSFNLLSVTKLTSNLPCCFTFHASHCTIQGLPS
ncbi:uncharacterized protein [Gossypium hirsutum]|uniref:Retrotransposon Copia-like N-terminal domain-containing protein n=1 Tax=Gossypium hirsutum TaxID=3635 RepID=A0ABM3AM90_GOSHI|nr:uncharacterized protein LOC121220352 [Gossypium hirsutum]